MPHYTAYDTRLASYAVILDELDGRERILLALWNDGARRQWTLPGGGVELHERVEDGVVREVLEETGYDVVLGDLLGVDTYMLGPERRLNGSDRALKAVRVVYSATVVGGELAHEVDGSTDEARWWPLDELSGIDRVSIVDIGLRLLRG